MPAEPMSATPLLSALLLLAGILPLAAGPFLADWADRSKPTKAAVDAFITISLGGIILLHLWPHAFLTAGAWALAGGAAGLLLPFLLHGSLHALERRIYPGLVGFAFFGLVIHAALDGAALLSPMVVHPGHEQEQNSAVLLAAAVILHRLPMGLAVWWLTVPILGRRVGVVLLASMAGATLVGFSVAGRLLVDLTMPGVAIFEATIAGMLLHVAWGHDHGHGEHEHGEHEHEHGEHEHGEHEHHPPPHAENPRASALGTATGFFFVIWLARFHPMEERFAATSSFNETLWSLTNYLALLLLIGMAMRRPLLSLFRRRSRDVAGN